SSIQIPALLKRLGVPALHKKDKKTGEETSTTSQLKLLNLYPRLQDRTAKRVVRALLNVRQARKLLSSYLKTRLGPDGRVQTSFGVATTESWRWTASAFLIGMGGAILHTVHLIWDCRYIYV